jgi:hypothetical protein
MMRTWTAEDPSHGTPYDLPRYPPPIGPFTLETDQPRLGVWRWIALGADGFPAMMGVEFASQADAQAAGEAWIAEEDAVRRFETRHAAYAAYAFADAVLADPEPKVMESERATGSVV